MRNNGLERIYSTYSVTGYFDTLFSSMLYASGGAYFFETAMTYEEDAWESEEATKVFETVGTLADYTYPDTMANANPQDFTQNKQLVLDNEALFMANGHGSLVKWKMYHVPIILNGT